MNNIIHKTFAEIDLQDPFFQSLKNDYLGFEDWFRRKKDQDAFVQYENNKIIGFLYLKVEENIVDDVIPAIIANKILKVGTFKIDAHGTKMGEQFIKIIMDYAVNEDVDVCYVTIYEKHDSLINLLQSFNRFLIISLDVLICRYSPLFRAFPALFISEEPHKSFYYPLCFRSQK